MNAAFDRVCNLHASNPSLGTRDLLSESDEVQSNGKVFKKAIYGKYKFMTYREMRENVYNLASGLSELGVTRLCIYMETRAEWMIAAHACFQHNIQVVTVYSTLGEIAVAQAIQEADIEVVLTSSALMESKMATVAAACPKLKTIVFAPFENAAQKLSLTKFPDTMKCVSYDEVLSRGSRSLIKTNPNEPITKDTIAMIMYTSGTTGKPKGVLLSHGNIVSCASSMYARISDFNNPFCNENGRINTIMVNL